uniref:Uncharacterized protein n=1 Tax=Strigamia maritima TaxID=126957 RepID=T1IXB1_STRMM
MASKEDGEDQDEDRESIISSINIFLSTSQPDYETRFKHISHQQVQCATCCANYHHYTEIWRFSLEIVPDKRNFTQTVGLCKKYSRSDAVSTLAFFYSQKEEDFMQSLLSDLKDEATKKKLDFCNHNFYVGMRKSVGEEWVTADGSFVFGSDFLPNLYKLDGNLYNEFCAALSIQKKFKVVQLQCQSNSNWNCFICEHPCKANESQNCFDLWNDKEVTHRTEAIEYCQMADVPGELIGISSSKLLNKLQAELINDIDLKNCSRYIAISNLFTLKYESVYEEPMSYVSTRFDIKLNTDINKHCLVLNMKSFKWVFAGCEEKHCFMCKIIEGIHEQPDYPDGTK